MATFTPNFNLRKPDLTDLVNVETDLNDNLDIIDANLGTGGGGELSGMEAPGFLNGFPGEGTTDALSTFSANDLYGSLVFIPVAIVVTKAYLYVGTSVGTISVAIWNRAGTTRLATTGSISCPASGMAEAAFASSVTIDPGSYRVGVSFSSASSQVAYVANAKALGGWAVLGVHPAPLNVSAAPLGARAVVPLIGLF